MVEQLSLAGISATLLYVRNTVRSVIDIAHETCDFEGSHSGDKLFAIARTLQDEMRSANNILATNNGKWNNIYEKETGLMKMRCETILSLPVSKAEIEATIRTIWDAFCQRSIDPVFALTRLRELYIIDLLPTFQSALKDMSEFLEELFYFIDELNYWMHGDY